MSRITRSFCNRRGARHASVPSSLVYPAPVLLASLLLTSALIACGGGARQAPRADADVRPGLAPSTLSRDSAMAIMRALEHAPLAPGATADRQRAFEWLASNEELKGIAIDGRYLKPLEESDYPFAGELLMQFAFGMAVYRLSPEGAESEYPAQVEAGLRSVIATYRTMVRDDIKLGDKFLEDLDQIRRLGRLREYIAKVDEQSR